MNRKRSKPGPSPEKDVKAYIPGDFVHNSALAKFGPQIAKTRGLAQAILDFSRVLHALKMLETSQSEDKEKLTENLNQQISDFMMKLFITPFDEAMRGQGDGSWFHHLGEAIKLMQKPPKDGLRQFLINHCVPYDIENERRVLAGQPPIQRVFATSRELIAIVLQGTGTTHDRKVIENACKQLGIAFKRVRTGRPRNSA